MAQRSLRASSRNENVLSFARTSAPDYGVTALNLVYQAAEIFSGMEDHARETEARAQSLCKSAAERLKQAERRTEAAERERWQTVIEVDCKLQDASKALKQAQLRLADSENRLTALEFREDWRKGQSDIVLNVAQRSTEPEIRAAAVSGARSGLA